MKKIFRVVLVFVVSLYLVGCTSAAGEEGSPPDDGVQIIGLVEDFGKRLQDVSLLAPEEVVRESIRDNYADFVSPALLEEWEGDPAAAPGRLVSSPWPDRIEVKSIEKLSDDEYEAKGEIIEVTSVEKESGGAAARRPVTIVVRRIEGRWLIVAITLGAYGETNSIVYKNTQYGFTFSLPETWEGYSIITEKWEGSAHGGPRGGEIVKTGPVLYIRHPEWTPENRRQDIPIMIFTLAQWEALQQAEFLVGPAPIGPSELGRNNSYVFALPARYNYAFPDGYQEVEEILKNDPLQAIPIE